MRDKRDIRESKANLSCRYCQVEQVYDLLGIPQNEYYASCIHPCKTKGMESIYIMEKPIFKDNATSCVKCIYAVSRNQLELFQVEA